jgi:seryl-tRNA synthetase
MISFFRPSNKQLKHKQTMQELLQLQHENASLDNKIKELSSSHAEMIQLRKDVQKLQQTNDMNNTRLGQLEEENESLRERLGNVVHSPLSDNEKQKIIQDSQHRLHSSAPASFALPNVRKLAQVTVNFSFNIFVIYFEVQ